MRAQRLTCPSCGAPLAVQPDDARVTCAYCSTPLVIENNTAVRRSVPVERAGPVWVRPQVSTAANISLAFGVVAWLFLPLVGALIAVIFGHKARQEIAASGGRLIGGSRALIGLLLGYLQLGWLAIFLLAHITPGGAG